MKSLRRYRNILSKVYIAKDSGREWYLKWIKEESSDSNEDEKIRDAMQTWKILSNRDQLGKFTLQRNFYYTGQKVWWHKEFA